MTITKNSCYLECTPAEPEECDADGNVVKKGKPGKCIITGDGGCGHPIKSYMQPKWSKTPKIVQARQKALRAILSEEELRKWESAGRA